MQVMQIPNVIAMASPRVTSRRSLSAVRGSRSLSSSKESFINEPRSDEQLRDGFWMQLSLSLVVIFEAAFIGAEIEAGGPKGNLRDHGMWYGLTNAFIILWIILISVRFYHAGWAAFRRAWNILDLALTLVAMIDAYMVKFAVGDDAMVGSFSVKRQFRILKLLRLFRLLQIIRLSEKLRRLSDGLFASLRIIGLVLILLLVVLYMGGVYMTIIVGHECEAEYVNWGDCDDFFGHVYGSMFTLFQVMTLDDWGMEIVRPSMKQKSWLVVFYVVFMMITTFGLLNVIVGAVVENTLNAADEAKLKCRKEEEKQIRKDLGHLNEFFLEADQDGNGLVDMDEFQTVLKNNTFKEVMKKLSLPTAYETLERLFDVFDVEEKGSVSIEDFTRGLFKFREQPAPMDMHTALMQINGLSAKMHTMEALLGSLLDYHGISTPVHQAVSSSRPNPGTSLDVQSASQTKAAVGSDTSSSPSLRLETDLGLDGQRQASKQSPSNKGLVSPMSTTTKLNRQVLQEVALDAQMTALEQGIVRCFEEIRMIQRSYKTNFEERMRETSDRSVVNDMMNDTRSEGGKSFSTETGGKTATGHGTPTPSLRHLRSKSLSRGLSKEVVML